MFNILVEPLIRMHVSDGSRVEASLPEVYAALMADEVEAFPALRPHQRHAWHAFLVQLGAMAMQRAGEAEPPADAEAWVGLIRGLTRDFPEDEPWQLVVDDITKPAFMQPPAKSAGKLAEYKSSAVQTPDELDMLVTSKNHDIKLAVGSSAQDDDWMFALVTLQTMDGNPGRNPGISRMNGAYGSRPAFSITPSTRTGKHVRRDIVVLLERRDDLLDSYPMSDGGSALIWTVPWDGGKVESLLVNTLDPLYIEVCRRIRLCFEDGGGLRAAKATAKATRIEAKALNGVTGDPWTPVDRGAGKSLTLAVGGFTYKRIVEYLDKWDQPVLCRPTDAEVRSPDTMHLVARGMVRGQGKTEGYYERAIPIRTKMRSAMLRRGSETDDLGRIANKRIEEVGKVQRILSHAIQVFLARGKTDKISSEHRNLARPWLNRLDEFVDARFFEALQDEFDADSREERERIRHGWLMNDADGVVGRARGILAEAMGSLTCPEIERYKARVAAEGLFEGRIRGNDGLPHLFTENGA